MNLKLFTSAAIAAALMASTASAQSWTGNTFGWFDPGSVYVGADAGYHLNTNVAGGSGAIGQDGVPYRWGFDAKNGYDVFARIGYRFNPSWRTELEFGYRNKRRLEFDLGKRARVVFSA